MRILRCAQNDSIGLSVNIQENPSRYILPALSHECHSHEGFADRKLVGKTATMQPEQPKERCYFRERPFAYLGRNICMLFMNRTVNCLFICFERRLLACPNQV